MGFVIFARLEPGQTREAATAALRAVQPQICEPTRRLVAGRDFRDSDRVERASGCLQPGVRATISEWCEPARSHVRPLEICRPRADRLSRVRARPFTSDVGITRRA